MATTDQAISLTPSPSSSSSSSDGDYCEPEHPLSIHTVFSQLSKHFGFTELLDYKLVSKQWLLMIDETLNSYGSDLIVTSTTTPAILDGLHTERVLRCTIKEFGYVRELGFSVPIQPQDAVTTANILRMLSNHNKFKHLSVLVLQDCRLTREQFQHLIRRFASKLQTLKIIDYRVYDGPGPGEEISFDSTILPIVKTTGTGRKCLKFPKVKHVEFKTWGIAGTVKAILDTFPGLVELKLDDCFGGDLSCPYLVSKIPYQNLLKLSMDYSQHYSINLFTCLTNMNLQLKSFAVSFRTGMIEFRHDVNVKCYLSFREFLRSQKNSLEELKIEIPSYDYYYEVNDDDFDDRTPNLEKQVLPCLMPKLGSLTLPKSFVSRCLRDTLDLTPKLTNLTILFYTGDKWNTFILAGNGVGGNVKCLTISKLDRFMVTHGPTLFPNLVELHLNNCTTDNLRLLFGEDRFQKQIEILAIYTVKDDGITDCGLLGLPTNLVLQWIVERIMWIVQQINISVDDKPFPHIGLMKKLKSLVITRDFALSFSAIQSKLFTMKSLIFGIFRLPELNEMILIGPNVLSVATEAAIHCEQFGFTFTEEEPRPQFPPAPALPGRVINSRTFKFSKRK